MQNPPILPSLSSIQTPACLANSCHGIQNLASLPVPKSLQKQILAPIQTSPLNTLLGMSWSNENFSAASKSNQARNTSNNSIYTATHAQNSELRTPPPSGSSDSSPPSSTPTTPQVRFAFNNSLSQDHRMSFSPSKPSSLSTNHNHDKTQDKSNVHTEEAPVYTGVSRSGLNGRWRAQLSTRGRTVHLGTFATAEEAAKAWDRAAVQERGKAAVTNFSLSDYLNPDGSLKPDVTASANAGKNEDGSGTGHKTFRGVYHSGTYGRWKARIVVNGQKIHLGTFATAEEAAKAWDLKAIEYRGKGTVTNFDPSDYAGVGQDDGKAEPGSDTESKMPSIGSLLGKRTADSPLESSKLRYGFQLQTHDDRQSDGSVSPTVCTPRDQPSSPEKRSKLSPILQKTTAALSLNRAPETEYTKSDVKRETECAVASLLSLCNVAAAMEPISC